MFDDAVLAQLKQVNTSVDKAKTKERVESLWKAASLSERKAFLESNSIKESNVFRIRKEGAIMPKMALYLAKQFNHNPLFLSGDIDEDTGWSEEVLNVFLENKGYSMPTVSPSEKPKRPYKQRAKTDDAPGNAMANALVEPDAEPAKEAPAVEAATPAPAGEPDSPPKSEYESRLTVEEMVHVLKALHMRAPHNPNAKKQYDEIERILLS